MVKREMGGMVVKKEMPPGGVMADGQKYACRSVIGHGNGIRYSDYGASR